MLSVFRRLLHSKIGALLAILFLGVIALAFVLGDVISGRYGSMFSGGGEVAAKAGGSRLTTAELQDRSQRSFEDARRQNPTMQIADFVSLGGVRQVFDELVQAMTIKEYAREQGVEISKRLVDAQIAQIPVFQDAAGAFSPKLFRGFLAQNRITEQQLRDDFIRQILANQIVKPTGLGSRLSDSMVLPYASLLLEARQGTIAAIPSMAFLDGKDPTDAQLAAFYRDNAARFTIPEQRRIRYAIIDADRFAQAAQPTDAEIAAYFNANRAQYAAKESRTIEQLVLPTQAAAKAIADKVRTGAPLAAAAQGAGLAVSTLADQSREGLTASSAKAVANAVFAAKQGELVGPVRGSLGWVLLRVTAIKGAPARTLASVHDEIATTLRAQKEKSLLADYTAKLEDQIANGSAFDQVVKDNGLTMVTTPPLLASGKQVEAPAAEPDADVKALLAPVFAMSQDDDAQLAPITPDKRYALAAPGDIIPAAPPPLAKVKPAVLAQYKLSQGAAKAKALAEQIQAKVAKGVKLADAIAQAGVKLPAPQVVGGRRADIMRGDQRPPAEIAILFAMAPGSVKTVTIPQDRGTFVVQLNAIKRGDAGQNAALVKQVRDQLSEVVGQEYGQQFERAVEKEMGVKRYPAAVASVTRALVKTDSGAQ
jgi:peptidyl-prolyl cis-trans isomerase D